MEKAKSSDFPIETGMAAWVPRSANVVVELEVRHTRCRHKKPLADVTGLPGDGAELRPAQLRAYANLLLEAADDLEAACKAGDIPHTKTYQQVIW